MAQENKLQSNVDLSQSSQNQYYTTNNQSSFGPQSQFGNPSPYQTGNYSPRVPQQINSQPYNPQQFQQRAPQQGPVLRRTDSRSYIPPQQGNLPSSPVGQQRLPLNFQPQNWNRPLRPPIRPEQQFRPQGPNSDQYRPQQTIGKVEQYRPLENKTYRPIDVTRNSSFPIDQPRPVLDPTRSLGETLTNERRPSEGYNPPQSGQYYQLNQQQRQQQIPGQQQQPPVQQYPPVQRPPLFRKPSPWALIKEKLPPHIQGNRFPFPLRSSTPVDSMNLNRSPSVDLRSQQLSGNQNPSQFNGQTPTTPQNVISTPNSQMERTTLNFSMADMPPRQIPPNVRPIRPLMRIDSRMMSPNDPNFRMPIRPGMMPSGRDSPSGQPPGMRMPNYPENPNYHRPPSINSSQPSSTTSSTPKSHRSSIDDDEDSLGKRDVPSRPPSAGGNVDSRVLQEKRPVNQKVFDPALKTDDFTNQNGRNMLRPDMVRLNTPPISELQQRDESSRWLADSMSNKPNRPTDLKIQGGTNHNLERTSSTRMTPTTPVTPTPGDLKRHSSLRQSKRFFSKGSEL